LLEKIEQVVKLIRSKGIGVFFVTQNPADVPESVLAQLGNRVQHALRAYTPREQKSVRIAAETFRPNPEFDVADTITRLGVGEALVSTLGDGGVPSVVERTLIRPPSSRLGPITPAERAALIKASPVGARYSETLDRESAFEMLAERAAKAAKQKAEDGERPESGFRLPDFGGSSRSGGRRSNRQSVTEAAVKSVVRSVGSSLGRALVRGILGSLAR
jgi:DNA helicase HerA-like ATPase